jgi:plastocyanin
MACRLAAIAMVVMAACGCGGRGGPAPADLNATADLKAEADLKVSTPRNGPGAGAKDGASAGTGKLASALAPAGTLIVLEPQAGVELPVSSAPAIMDQAGYEFLPAFLIAQAGQQVQFRNSEDVLHNVRVTDAASQEPVFNVATLAFGKYEHKFQPGYYNVTCDIHSTMRAGILVTASPYTATTGADGGFNFSNVLPGQYNLTIYAGAAPVVRPVEVKSGRTELGVIK